MRAARKNKYGAKRCIVTADGTLFELAELVKYNIMDVTGIAFDSKMEARYYLHLMRMKGINQIELQPAFTLQDKPKITYKADFRVTWSDGRQEIIDVKGHETAAFRLKAKLFRKQFPLLPLTLVTLKRGIWTYKEVRG